MTIALERPTKKSRLAQIREQLGYPIIDTDVHTQEFEPAFFDYLLILKKRIGNRK